MTALERLLVTAGLLAALAAPNAAAAQPRCLKALAPLAAGAIASSGDFAPADCPAGRIAAAFRHDRAGSATHLARDVARAEIVPAFPEFGVGMARPGQKLRLVAVSGAVRVEREVEAMQSARPGQRLFVRDSDGRILSVRYAGDAR